VPDLTPLAHRSYLAEVERSARARPAGRTALPEPARRAVAAALRAIAALRSREAQGA
jgi:hypothetical protein